MQEVVKKIDVLNAIKRVYDRAINAGCKYDADVISAYADDIMQELPRSKTAKWYECGPMLLGRSSCRKVIGAPITNAPNYCENCGAKMYEDEEPEQDPDVVLFPYAENSSPNSRKEPKENGKGIQTGREF